MAADIGLKIGLEGEKEFKKALSEINSQFKVLGSEMQLVTSECGKNNTSVESLTAKNKVLTKEIETQKSKIETLKAGVRRFTCGYRNRDDRSRQEALCSNLKYRRKLYPL